MSKRVPAKLHHELAEYASLLRALRVRDTLDVTKHITQPNPFAVNTTHDDTEFDSGDDLTDDDVLKPESRELSRPPSAIASGSKSQSVSVIPDRPKSAKARGKQKAVAGPGPKKPKRDHWTRWPLLLEDVVVPEWSLEDEVAVIVAQHMKGRSPSDFPIPVAEGDSVDDEEPMYTGVDLDYDEEDPEPPFYVPYITAVIANYLTTVLAALAAHIPARTAGFQNRIEPMGWRTVIDVLVACAPSEFVNPKIVETVIKRMEAIYGPSIIPLEGEKSTSFRAVERINVKNAAMERLNGRIDEEAARSSNQTEWPSMAPSRKKLRRLQDEEVDDDDDDDDSGSGAGSKKSKKRKRNHKRRTSSSTAAPTEDTNHIDGQSSTVISDPRAGGGETSVAATSAAAERAEEGRSLRRSTRTRVTRQFNFPSADVFME